MKNILIRIDNKVISFNEDDSLPLTETNVPFQYLKFKESAPIYWKVEMVSFTKGLQSLKVKVIDFHPEDVSSFTHQRAKYVIKRVEFLPVHWSELQFFLTTYKKKNIKDFITEEPFTKVQLTIVQIPLTIKIKALKFELGKVSFLHHFKWSEEGDRIEIPLPESIPEYDFIKPYFKKIIGKSTIDVVVDVAASTQSTKISKVKSIDLEKINEDSIQVLKVKKLDQWSSRKPKFAPSDQDVFTFEEAMASYGDEALGNIDVLEKDLLFHILGKEGIRNRFQLQYLSERIHSSSEKLLMTLVPQFGFVFVHRGEEMLHLIWELLNSHATYIWSFLDSNLSTAIKNVQNEIRTINVHGRSQYRASFTNTEEMYFNILVHRTSNYSYEAYFSRWKRNLDQLMI